MSALTVAGERLWAMSRQERRRLRRSRVESARFQRRAMHTVPYARRVEIQKAAA